MAYRLLVSDFDGTMCSDNYQIPQENIITVNNFIKNGGNILIATGRLFQAIYPHLEILGIKDGEVICHQGAVTYDIKTKKAINTIEVDIDEAIKAIEFCEKSDCLVPIIFLDDIAHYEKEDKFVDLFANVMQIPLKKLGMKISTFLKEKRPKFTKILIQCQNEEKDEKMLRYIQDNLSFSIIYNRAHKCLYEAVSKNASKGNALRDYAKRHNFKKEEIIAIGDAENDISMLDYAGLAIATQNASDIVKKHADVIGESNNNSAVAKVIKEYMLNEN